MLFERIGRMVTKHHKAIIVIWLVVLLVSVPAILSVDKAVNYDVSFSSGEYYESVHANDVISSQFRTSVANGTIIVLLQSDNVTDASTRDFVLALQQRIASSPNIKDLEATSSVYSYSIGILAQVIQQIGPGMRMAEQNISFGAFLLWGLPAMHANAWAQAYSASSGNESFSSAQAYSATSTALTSYLASVHADAATTALAFGYYDAFAAAWNVTASATPLDRATVCVNAVAPAFIGSLPSSEALIKTLMSAVLGRFNLTSFDNATVAHQLALNVVGNMASITNLTFLQAVYDLGPAINGSTANAFALSIVSTGTLDTYPYAIPAQLVNGLVSSNKQSMLMMVTFTVSSSYTLSNGDKPLLDDVGVVRDEIKALKDSTGSTIRTYVTGDAAISADMEQSSLNDLGLIEPFTIIIIIVLMGILFRSFLGQLLPLGAVGVAIGISQALVFIIGSTIAQINFTVLTMLFAVLMGVGTDYSIFIMTRYREERIRGATREKAVQTAVTWAGESIVTSGATVIIAFMAMALTNFSFVQTMGLLLGLAIIVALAIALTMVPSVLMLVGNRIFWPTTGKRWDRFAQNLMQRKREGNHGYFHRAASFSVKHAKVVVLAAVLVSVPTTYVFLTQETSFDFIGSMSNTEGIQGMNALTTDFGAGAILPTQVVIIGNTVVYQNGSFNNPYLDAVDNVTATLAADSLVQKVTSITRPFGLPVDYHGLSNLSAEARTQLVASMLQFMGSDNKSVLITVVLKEQPQKASVVNHIVDMRKALADEKANLPALAGSTILVGGETAALYDIGQSTSRQFGNIEVIVIIGIFLVLMVVLGSLLLPTFAIVSIAMSITWAFSAVTLVFGNWLGKPILWIIPLILFVMLMGIGMDYNVFILTRIREEAQKHNDIKHAVVEAVDWTGGIITALALIMAGAFGSLMISSNAMLQEFGFALLLAVVFDAMIVRTYIVPAAIVLMGKKAWWAPGRLQRVGREEKMAAKKAEREKKE